MPYRACPPTALPFSLEPHRLDLDPVGPGNPRAFGERVAEIRVFSSTACEFWKLVFDRYSHAPLWICVGSAAWALGPHKPVSWE